MRGELEGAVGLLARWPEVQRAVAQATPLETNAVFPPEAAGVGRAPKAGTLQVAGCHLTGQYDRAREAEVQAAAIAPEATRVAVYGFGLGDLPAQLLASHQALQHLAVHIFQPGLVVPALLFCQRQDPDALGWLADLRLGLSLARDAGVEVSRDYAIVPGSLSLAEDGALALRDAVYLACSENYERQRHRAREPMLQASMADNVARIEQDHDVATLFGSAAGARVVVAAGGPTLSEGLPWIKQQRADSCLLAVSTALLPLIQADIVPDIVIVVDPKPALQEHFIGLPLDAYRNTPLVYAPVVQPAVLEAWPGPRYGSYLTQDRYAELRQRLPRGELFCGATVTHAAVDLAVKLGPEEVVVWGADFAYLNGRSHAVGAAQERGVPDHANVSVVNGFGERCLSDLAMVGFLRDLERYIDTQPTVRFRVGSRHGAAVRGTVALFAGPESEVPSP